MMNSKVPTEVEKIMERLFVFVDSKDIDLNSSINLVVNPQILKILFKMMEPQPNEVRFTVLKQLSQIFRCNAFNSIILAKRDREIIEFNYSLLDQIITFALGIQTEETIDSPEQEQKQEEKKEEKEKEKEKDEKQLLASQTNSQCKIEIKKDPEAVWQAILKKQQSLQKPKAIKGSLKLGKLIIPFVKQYPVTCKNIKNVISKVVNDFNSQKCNHTLLEASIQVLYELLNSQIPISPNSFFVIYGEESGIKLIQPNIKWPFAKGFYFYTHFYLEDHRKDKLPSMSLFSCSVNGDTFELSIDSLANMYVKCFGMAKQIRLATVARHQWHFLKLSYCLKTGIISNNYQLSLNLNGEVHEKKNLPVPNISMKNQINELTFGRDFYGRINVIGLSRAEVQNWLKQPLNKWSDIESLLVINKKDIRQFFLLYHASVMTELNGKDIVYDITSQNHGEMLDNTAVHVNPFLTVDVNYYGGIYTFLPFLHILKFYKVEKYPRALEDVLELISLLFKGKFINVEIEAINCQFCTIAGQLINEIDQEFLTFRAIEILGLLKSQIINPFLQKEFLTNLLWKIQIRKIKDSQVIHALFSLIGQYYEADFVWSYRLMPLEPILRYAIQNFEPLQISMCCPVHWSKSFQKDRDYSQLMTIQDRYRQYSSKFRNILKLIFIRLPQYPELAEDNTQLLNFLLFKYSVCFKTLILESLAEGVRVEHQFYLNRFNLLSYLFELISQSTLPEEFSSLLNIFIDIIQADQTQGETIQAQVIAQVGNQMDKLFILRYNDIRVRSKSEKIKEVKEVKEKIIRKNSAEMEGVNTIQKELKKKIKELKQEKVTGIESDNKLYNCIVKLCFEQNHKEKDWLLKDDIFMEIVQPYFRLCGIPLKVSLINMIRNTVLLRTKDTQDVSVSINIKQFDRLYRFVLFEFVMRELAPNAQQTEQSNYLMRNIFYIVDHSVKVLKQNWRDLYQYLLRLVSLLEDVKLDIQRKTHLTQEEIHTATRICIRKFVFRIIALAQKDLQNMPNLIFLVFLVVFTKLDSNELVLPYGVSLKQSDPPEPVIFQYFAPLQQFVYLHKFAVVSKDSTLHTHKLGFVDSKLIIETIKGLNLQFSDPETPRLKSSNIINAYFDLEAAEKDSQICRSRVMYLTRTNFKSLGDADNSLKGLISIFLVGEEVSGEISVAEMISLMLGLCIETSLLTEDADSLKDSIDLFQNFFKSFVMVCSRDDLKQEDHGKREKKNPKEVSYFMIHFIFSMLQRKFKQELLLIVEDALYHMLCFVGLVITSLNEKLGCPEDASQAILLSGIMKDVESYNFFSFQILQGIIPIRDLRQLPFVDRDRAIDMIRHPKLKQNLNEESDMEVEYRIKLMVQTHKGNLCTTIKALKEKLARVSLLDKITRQVHFLEEEFQQGVMLHMKTANLHYRRGKHVWRKVWKRLRLYHYFWSTKMNQSQHFKGPWQKNSNQPYKHKLSKFLDQNGARPILEVSPVQPWHVKKMELDKLLEYRTSNYLYGLHKEIVGQKKIKTFFQKIMTKTNPSELNFYVDWIKHNSKRKGFLSISGQKLKFCYNSTYQKDSHLEFTSFILAEHRPIEKFWPLIQIVNILPRRYLLRKQCLLIEFQDNTALIFNFINRDVEEFLRAIENKQAEKSEKMGFMKLNNVEFFTRNFRNSLPSLIQEATQKWRNWRISNFEYIMLLNKFAGRSYLDPSNYPVFPWILHHSESKMIEYRDLSKTVGALGSEARRQFYRNKLATVDPFNPVPPYQYGSHYSSPGMIFNFLIRLRPYTEASRALQGGRFDLSDRLFSSLKICWNSVTNEISDVRELIPEFFYLPEVLINMNEHNFGLTQQGLRVHNVDLPGWAANAYDYVTKHRRKLQSDTVSENLHHWVDLIFGYKQKGKLAEENYNVFFYLTYQNGVDLDQIDDPQTKISTEAQVMHFGQTPTQLFTKPHPSRPKIQKRDRLSFTKVKLLFSLNTKYSAYLLCHKDEKLILFKQFCIMVFLQRNQFKLENQIPLLRNSSKENLYHTEDLDCERKIKLFHNNKFIVIGAYVNGDIIVFSAIDGRKIEQKKGHPKNCIYINQAENLLLCGCKNGLLEVYEIVYGEKQNLTLVKISAEYYMAPITSITEGGNFYAVVSGNIVVINKIHRGLSFVYDKSKMKGFKMIRSFESARKILGALICCDPLFCVVFYNALEIYVYSINGQLLKTKQIEAKLAPQVIRDDNFADHLIVLQEKQAVIYSTPDLSVVRTISLPSESYREMKIFGGKCYLVTIFGEVMCLSGEDDS